MSQLIQLQSGSKAYGHKVLLEDASFAVGDKEHIGVIGPNGAGKSTLFKILTGKIELDEGLVTRSQGLRVGYLEQEETWDTSHITLEWLSGETEKPEWSLKKIAIGLGLSTDQLESPLGSLSGGYRMRVKLTALLASEPNLLLLDEPTNYLDLETLVVLESFLQNWKGAFMVISHDREFLNRVTDHTLEVEAGDINKFPGNIDDYFLQKEQLRALLQKQAHSAQNRRQQILDFARKFGAKATKAKQVQSRLKSLDKMPSIEIKPLPIFSKINIPPPTKTAKDTVTFSDVQLGYGEKAVLSEVSFRLQKGDHLAIVGVNGAGKSTLLKTVAGLLAPLTGDIQNGHNVDFGYFAQHVSETLDDNETVLGELQKAAHSDILPQQILDLAGSLLFSGEDVEKKVKVLSGGERSRVALGQILLKKKPCLLLDEPTNHLDFQTVEALAESLREYPGTLLVVSHDRSFIKAVATKILEIRDGKANFYPGTYDEYAWSVQKGVLSNFGEDQGGEAAAKKKRPGNFKQERKRLDKMIKDYSKKASQCEREVSLLHEQMEKISDSLQWTQGADAEKVAKELHELKQKHSSLESDWLAVEELLEQSKKELESLINK